MGSSWDKLHFLSLQEEKKRKENKMNFMNIEATPKTTAEETSHTFCGVLFWVTDPRKKK